MRWQVSWRGERASVRLADRHYSRQSVGSAQFVPPGRSVVLRTPDADALWVTSWPYAQYVKREWKGAWLCSLFRNEAPDRYLSSELVREAIAATRWFWPQVPDDGMVTFVDASKVRHKRDAGRCFRKAGFRPVGFTASGLVALQLLPVDMPAAEPPLAWGRAFRASLGGVSAGHVLAHAASAVGGATALSLWDTPIATRTAMTVPPPQPTPKPLRTAPLLVASGKRPGRDTRLVVAGEGDDEQYAYMGAMACGREREYALLVRWDARDDAMAPRRCVSIERVRMVVMDDGEGV